MAMEGSKVAQRIAGEKIHDVSESVCIWAIRRVTSSELIKNKE
jgi:hypothetical protein